MVGTIFGLGLSQQFDADGDPLVGCKLYLYEAGTSTPVTTYQDYGLTSGLEHPHPIVADAAGRIPAFWVADGSYRVRLTNALGSEIFDETSITAIGASSGTASGGGVSTQVTFQTGDMICTFDEGTRDGWVRMWGSVGNSSSSATNRANADCENLFTFLWDNVSDTYAAVSSGRGASAAADWAASKTIAIPDMQGRMFIGLDDMAGGSPAADVVAAAVVTAYAGGSEEITIAETNLPSHTHGPGTLTVAAHDHGAGTFAVGAHDHGAGTLSCDPHTHDAGTLYVPVVPSGTGQYADTNEETALKGTTSQSVLGLTGSSAPAVSGTTDSTTPTFSGTSGESAPAVDSGITGATGGGTALASMNPYRAGSWYIKL